MSRLLRADFSRMFKSLVFKLGILFSVAFAVVMVVARYIDFKVNADIYAQYADMSLNANDFIFAGGFFIVFMVAVFKGLFVGADYSDGTIRNKLMIGHRRSSIYFANYVTCYAATLIFNFAYIITVFVFSLIMFGNAAFNHAHFFVNLGFLIITSTALVALFLFFAMLINNKAAASVTLLILAIAMWFSAMLLTERLAQTEYFSDIYYVNEEGEVIQDQSVKNPQYLTGIKREIYEFVDDFLPSTQYYQILQWNVERPIRFLLCDAAMVIVMTGAGVMIFKRKDLK